MASGIVARISGTTLWRWLGQDALRPWRHRSWIFPRDPHFARKAGRILDLYQRRWKGAALGPRDYVLCIDEKTSIQARRRKHRSLPPAPGRPIYVEHEYARAGALAYLAAWDVQRAKLFGRCERKNGIAAFEHLVAQTMGQEPYRSARRVFLIVDNGSSHRGRRAAARLRAEWPNTVLVHTPVLASWLKREYSWPGNIRELVNTLKKVVAVGSDSAVSDLVSMVTATRPPNGMGDNLSLKQAARAASRQVEKEMILKVLAQTHWNRKRAAQHLQISYKALLYKLRQMGLDESGTL